MRASLRPDCRPASKAGPAISPKTPQTADKAIITVYTKWKTLISANGSGTRLSRASNITVAEYQSGTDKKVQLSNGMCLRQPKEQFHGFGGFLVLVVCDFFKPLGSFVVFFVFLVVVRKYSIRPLNSLKTRHARLGKVRPVAWRFELLSSGGTNRLGATTIRHNVPWAAIFLLHSRGLWRLSGAQHIPGFLCSVAFSSACGEPVLTEAVGLLSRTSAAAQSADRRCSHQPRVLVEVLRLAISFGDRQT